MKLLGIDYGRRKIGLATIDSQSKLSFPLTVIQTTSWESQIKKIAQDEGIEKIIIGLPTGVMDLEIKQFGQKVMQICKIEVDYFDETLSSQDAQKQMIQLGKKAKNRKNKEDAIAAAIMLQLFIESNPRVFY